jgi:hypothetical protein
LTARKLPSTLIAEIGVQLSLDRGDHVRIIVFICTLGAALLSGWAAYAMYSSLVGQADGDIVYGALAASWLAVVTAAVAVGLSLLRRREWPVAYLVSSLAIALLSVVIGTWALAAT